MILGRSKKRIAPTRNSLDVSYLEGGSPRASAGFIVGIQIYHFRRLAGFVNLLVFLNHQF